MSTTLTRRTSPCSLPRSGFVPLLGTIRKSMITQTSIRGARKWRPWRRCLLRALTGGTDLMVYRKGPAREGRHSAAKTLDDFIVDVKKLNDPDHGVYGIALRGQRGSGRECLAVDALLSRIRWPMVRRHKPVFNSDAFIRQPDLSRTVQIFAARHEDRELGRVNGRLPPGHVALLVESSPLAGEALDPKVSKVVGKVGYTAPPSPLTGGGYAHGLAIGTKGNKDDAAKKCAGLFIAWATSKEKREASPRRRHVWRAEPNQHHDQ